MKLSAIADRLWGEKAKFSYLLVASIVLLLTALGARDIWTQEHRWADIVSGMFYRHDFLHPYLGENRYYDKPLLSYWLIALIAKLTGSLSVWALRLPSALSGLLAIWSIYRLGEKLKNKQLGLMAGWMLLTTFYFVFWARTSSADMLNLAGSLFAVAWYFTHREKAGFFDFAVFFIILALTSLCKGLGGAIVPLLVVGVDVLLNKSWKRYLRLSVVLSVIPALIIYLVPFWASSYYGGESYGQNGLYLVYRENILRYFHPFDHQGPIYTYFIYLPIYTLPWALFFFPALCFLPSRWRTLTVNARWIAWALFVLFAFFTASGSRRSYYVLPMVPFAILFTADWIASGSPINLKKVWCAGTTVATFILLFVALDLIPAWYYSQYGVGRFAEVVKQDATQIKPWRDWNIVMLDGESKLNFYLDLTPSSRHYGVIDDREAQTTALLVTAWPILKEKPANTIFITRKLYAPLIASYFAGYQRVEVKQQTFLPFLDAKDINVPVAFIPK